MPDQVPGTYDPTLIIKSRDRLKVLSDEQLQHEEAVERIVKLQLDNAAAKQAAGLSFGNLILLGNLIFFGVGAMATFWIGHADAMNKKQEIARQEVHDIKDKLNDLMVDTVRNSQDFAPPINAEVQADYLSLFIDRTEKREKSLPPIAPSEAPHPDEAREALKALVSKIPKKRDLTLGESDPKEAFLLKTKWELFTRLPSAIGQGTSPERTAIESAWTDLSKTMIKALGTDDTDTDSDVSTTEKAYQLCTKYDDALDQWLEKYKG